VQQFYHATEFGNVANTASACADQSLGFGNRDPGFENSREFVSFFIFRFSEQNSREYPDGINMPPI